MLTRTLQEAKIDQIEYLSEIPYCYSYGYSKITEFVIPDKIEFVNSEAFANCSQLHDVIFGKDVSVIYYGAFEGCDITLHFHNNNEYAIEYCQRNNMEYKFI